jgi:hypothetical protein
MLSLIGCSALLVAAWAVPESRSADTPPGAAKPAEPAEQPPVVQTMPAKATVSILGKPVVDKENKQVGRVIDVLVDGSGEPQAAVLDFGGFMGVGNRTIAVHWAALHFDPEGPHPVQLELTPDELKAVPEYRGSNKPAPVVTPARVTAPLAEGQPPSEAPPSEARRVAGNASPPAVTAPVTGAPAAAGTTEPPPPGTSVPVLTVAPPGTNTAAPSTVPPVGGTQAAPSALPPGATPSAPPAGPPGLTPQTSPAPPPGTSPPRN